MKRLAVLAAFVAISAAAISVHEQLYARRALFPPEGDVLYVPPARHLDTMSLGYREALADLIWVRALIFSGTKFSDDDAAAITRYTDAITGLAPRFERAYAWGGITIIYGGTEIIERDMVDRAIAIYRRGLAQFPESHQLLYSLGMLLIHQVPSTAGYDPDEIAAARREGIELIRRAAAFGADPLVRRYAATLVAEHATQQLAVAFLESQLALARDDADRRLLRKKLAEVGAPASFEQIEAIRGAFLRELRVRAPYLPDAVWAVIRPEHAAPIPETWGRDP